MLKIKTEMFRIKDISHNEKMNIWENCLGKFFKGEIMNGDKKHNALIFPYRLVRYTSYLQALYCNLDSCYKGLIYISHDLMWDVNDYNLEEISKEEFVELIKKHDDKIIEYRINKFNEEKDNVKANNKGLEDTFEQV